MKKLIAALLVSIFCIVGIVDVSFSKDVNIQVDFGFDQEFEADVTEYILYYQYPLDSNTLVEITKITDVSARSFFPSTFDLPPGKTSNFYISATYDTGEMEYSDPYPWKFTGRPTIIDLKKIK